MAKKSIKKDDREIFLILGITFVPLGFAFLLNDPGLGIPFLLMAVVFMGVGVSGRGKKKKKKK